MNNNLKEEVGYVIMLPDSKDSSNTYFRGCGRCGVDKWCKSIRSAQMYKSSHSANKTIQTSNKIADYERKYCKILKVEITLEEM